MEKKLTIDQTIALLSIYESEWEHRNNILWKQSFKFFYLSIIVMIIPNISEYLSLKLPNISTNIFPIAGIISATISLYIALGYNKRLEASAQTYWALIDKLPKEYHRIRLNSLKYGKYFAYRLSKLIPFILYCLICFIGAFLIFTK